MTGYTDDELQGAVEKLVRTAVRRPYGTLGNRDVSVTFNDLQEVAVATFLASPSAPFYVVWLGKERARALVAALRASLVEMNDLAVVLNRNVRTVDSIAALNNARTALLALETAGSSRTSGYTSIKSAPAYQRFDQNLQRFIDDYGSTVRKNGVIVSTPQQAVTRLGDVVSEMKAGLAELKRVVTALSSSIGDYSSMNLPAALSNGVVERARQVLDERIAEIEALTPEARLEKMRDLMLDVLACRVVIRNFASLSAPTVFVEIEGSGQVYADADHPATPAVLTATLPSPYALQVDRDVWSPSAVVKSELDVVVEGSLRFTLGLGGGYVARLLANIAENYEILASPDPNENDSLEIDVVDGASTYTLVVPLTAGAARTADQIAADINAAVTVEPIEARASFSPSKFTGLVNIAGADPAAVTFTHVNPFADWSTLFVLEGDRLVVWTGANAGVIYQVNVGGVSASTLTCTRLTGAGTTAETGQWIEVGSPNRVVEIRVPDSYAATALANRTSVAIGGASGSIEERTAHTFGWLTSTKATSQVVKAEDLVTIGNQQTTSAFNDASRLTCSLELHPLTLGGLLLQGIEVRTTPGLAGELVVLRFRGFGDITVGGTSATLSIPGSGAQIGDEVVVRGTLVAADQDARGVVTGVAGSIVSATFSSSLTAGTNILFEISPDMSGLPAGAVVELLDGPNQGRYYVTGQGSPVLSELAVARPVPQTTANSGLPFSQTGSVGLDYLVLASTDTSVSTSVQVDQGLGPNPRTAKDLFFSGPLATAALAVGTTEYFKLESWPRDIAVGDVLEIYETQYNVPDATYAITDLDKSNLLVQVDAGIGTDLPVQSFAIDQPLPFARVRRTVNKSFEMFHDAAVAWLAGDALSARFIYELDRLVAVVLAQDNPTVGAVNDLRLQIQWLLAVLTIEDAQTYGQPTSETIEYAFDAFDVSVVHEVDVLIETLHQRAAERALDTLLEGRFSDFFGLSADGMSYQGAVLEGVRAIARQDMPVSKNQRPRQLSLGELGQQDFEYDQSDIDPTEQFPDAPGNYKPSNLGDAY